MVGSGAVHEVHRKPSLATEHQEERRVTGSRVDACIVRKAYFSQMILPLKWMLPDTHH